MTSQKSKPEPEAQPVNKALLFDIAVVLAFSILATISHTQTLAGFFRTFGFYTLGVTLSWVVTRARLAPYALWPSGVMVWIGTAIIGQFLWSATHEWKLPIAMFVVTLAILSLGILGWRAALILVRRRR